MPYPGGKGGSGVAQKIINQIPPHRCYIEPFVGSGTILRLKRPALASIVIDSDAAVIASWQAGEWPAPSGTLIQLGDAVDWLDQQQWAGDEYVYCDPPYLFSVRSSDDSMYQCEFGMSDQHERLLKVLRSLPCMVSISGYWSQLYAEQLQDWRTIHFNTIARSGKPRTEWLWMNYPEPQALHDYQYLGEDYREREKLARQRRRWVERLRKMPAKQRLMLAAAIADYGERISDDGQH